MDIKISPATATLAVHEGTQLTAVARDEFGNVVPSRFDWAIDGEGGSITGDGLFTADTVSGTYADTVVTSLQTESGELSATASITVEPGPLSRVAVEPAEVALEPTATQLLSFTAYDEFGNRVSEVTGSWSGRLFEAVSIDSSGLVHTGTKAGLYLDAIQLDVVQGASTASATIDVAIAPGPLATIKVEPALAVARRGDTIRLTAVGIDEFGNAVPGVEFAWEAKRGVTVDQNGNVATGAAGPSIHPPASLAGGRAMVMRLT